MSNHNSHSNQDTESIDELTEKYYKATKTLLELAEDRGFPVKTTNVDYHLFKQRFEYFKADDQTGVLDVVLRNKKKRLIISFLKDKSFTETIPKKITIYFQEQMKKMNKPEYINKILLFHITNLIETHKINEKDDILLVYNNYTIDFEHFELFEKNNLRIVPINKLLFNCSRHDFVPKHQYISLEKEQEVMESYKLQTKQQLPHISFLDPQVIYHGFKVNDIIKITRKTITGGQSNFYRYVSSNTITKYDYYRESLDVIDYLKTPVLLNPEEYKNQQKDIKNLPDDDDENIETNETQVLTNYNNSDVIKFYSKSKNLKSRLLSNFSETKIKIHDIEFNTGEHAYQYLKFKTIADSVKEQNPKRAEQLINHAQKIVVSTNPQEAKKMGGTGKLGLKISEQESIIWELEAESIQEDICIYKIENYSEIREYLLNTGDNYLLHQENRAKPSTKWGGRIKNGELIGENKLGEIWMKLRAVYNKKDIVSPEFSPKIENLENSMGVSTTRTFDLSPFLNNFKNTQIILDNEDAFSNYFKNYFKLIFSNYDYINDLQEIIRLYKKVNKDYERESSQGFIYKIFIIQITSDYSIILSQDDEQKLANTKDRRYKDIYDMFVDALEYCDNQNLPVPNVSIPIFISDHFPFNMEELNLKYPFFCISTSLNKPYPLLPDNTFKCFSFKKRFGEECVDWDESKEIIEENLVPISNDKLFFKGKNTTNRRTFSRELFVENQLLDKMNISFLSKNEPYEPIYNFGRYKYLLDLPGRYEWSNRFPKLFLLERVVIRYTNTIKEYPEKEMIAFTDLLTRENVHYFKFKDELTENKEFNKEIIKNTIKDISEKIDTLDNDVELYDKVQNAGTKLMKTFDNNHIHRYLWIAMSSYKHFFDTVKVKQSIV